MYIARSQLQLNINLENYSKSSLRTRKGRLLGSGDSCDGSGSDDDGESVVSENTRLED